MFSKLLIPVDGSDPAARAARIGFELAAAYDAAVDVLHVVADDDTRVRGEALLDDTASLAGEDGPVVETHLVEGTPAKAIVSHADDAGADLLVMGRHGRRGITEHLLGSTSERVLRGVDVPVLTVPDGDESPAWNPENVLLTTDGSAVAERAAPYGVDVARRLTARLHRLSVVDVQAEAGPFDAGGVSPDYVERLEATAEDALDRLTEDTDLDGLDVASAVVRGRAVDEITAYVEEQAIDLLVMASHGETNLLDQQLGSTTNRVLNAVKRPVLVVPSRN